MNDSPFYHVLSFFITFYHWRQWGECKFEKCPIYFTPATTSEARKGGFQAAQSPRNFHTRSRFP